MMDVRYEILRGGVDWGPAGCSGFIDLITASPFNPSSTLDQRSPFHSLTSRIGKELRQLCIVRQYDSPRYQL